MNQIDTIKMLHQTDNLPFEKNKKTNTTQSKNCYPIISFPSLVFNLPSYFYCTKHTETDFYYRLRTLKANLFAFCFLGFYLSWGLKVEIEYTLQFSPFESYFSLYI